MTSAAAANNSGEGMGVSETVFLSVRSVQSNKPGYAISSSATAESRDAFEAESEKVRANGDCGASGIELTPSIGTIFLSLPSHLYLTDAYLRYVLAWTNQRYFKPHTRTRSLWQGFR